MDFEVDLMIKPTEEEIQKWITAGAKRLIIHVESVENPEAFVEKIRHSFRVQILFFILKLEFAAIIPIHRMMFLNTL